MPTKQERGVFSDALPLRSYLLPALICGGLVGVIIVVAFAVRDKQTEYSKFFATCIEYHSESRCMDFYRYGRLDLGARP